MGIRNGRAYRLLHVILSYIPYLTLPATTCDVHLFTSFLSPLRSEKSSQFHVAQPPSAHRHVHRTATHVSSHHHPISHSRLDPRFQGSRASSISLHPRTRSNQLGSVREILSREFLYRHRYRMASRHRESQHLCGQWRSRNRSHGGTRDANLASACTSLRRRMRAQTSRAEPDNPDS